MGRIVAWIIKRKVDRKMNSFFSRILKGELGWKSLIAAAIIFIAVAGEAMGWLEPGSSEKIIRFGEVIGIIGLRDAIGKVKKQ